MTAGLAAEKETLRRVQDSLFHLTRGLTPFVEGRMRKVHGERWLHYASRAQGSAPGAALDAYGLLKTMIDNWRDVFDEAFPRHEKHRVRNFASTALEARNATSHLTLPLQDDEALRYLDAVHALLRAVKAPQVEVDEAKALYDAQRRCGVAAPAPTPQPVALPLTPAAEREGPPTKALRPWIEVALPHPDVLANRFKEAEFAADLFAVDAGHVDPTSDYATAKGFFEITFLTEGLRRVLTTALERLGGKGGDPVIGLQTAFGGGKTHTMLAAYHLARADELAPLRGVAELAAQAGITGWKRPKVAVFVGTAKGADTPLNAADGPRVRTLWGYLAWRLAGQPGLDVVAEAEAARTNPGSGLLVELFRLSGPALILLDELVAYARQLPDDRFEAFLSFVQSLTEAAKMSPGVLVIGSLPESDVEAGGAKGALALRRLQSVFGRVHSPWLPASGDETYEIIRRRLFQALDPEGERARDETVKAFHDLYRKNPAEFPPETKDARYLELLRLSYPIHPELFDRLAKDWAGLDRFQRTRGVLRFMANVVGVLWQAQARDPLITPARVPLGHERVRASVLYPLDAGFAAVVDKEVDGDGSLPARMEANPSRRIAQFRAATRAARAVFVCSAPSVGQPNAGLTGQGLRLACAEPGDQLAIFGEALRELTERATYLYEDAGRYWFSTQPTLNRVADERAKAFPEHEIDAEIVKALAEDAKATHRFHRVFAAPDDPAAIDEASELSLVILGPSRPHLGKAAARSAATDAAMDTLARCRGGPRRLRNTLLFVAADESLLASAREAMRKARAWGEISEDKRLLATLTNAQTDDAKEKARTSRDGAVRAVRLAWSHVLYPFKSDATQAGKPFDLEHLAITARDRASLPAVVYDKAKADGIISEELRGGSFWRHLEPLWPDDRPHLDVAEVAEWFATYVYLPKLRDRVVLDGAIRDAVAKLDPAFALAMAFDPASGRYQDLTWARMPPEVMPSTAVLVRASVAQAQLEADAPKQGGGQPAESTGTPPALESVVGNGPPSQERAPRRPTRFYGSVEIDMLRPVKAFDAILNAVVLELQRTPGAKVRLTLEVEAEAPEGFADGEIGVVRDNARQLKFKAESTGFED